ncbi:MAG: hypothetical protein R3C18_21180 [Planctomycetaceae bacterium]
MNRHQRKLRKLRKRKSKLRNRERRNTTSQKSSSPKVEVKHDWRSSFLSKYRNAILSVIAQAMPLDPRYYCGQIALIAKKLSEDRLNVASGWLLMIDDPQQPPLLLEHAWNECEDGTRIDLSPWDDCPLPRNYVPRNQRERVNALVSTPQSEEWHARLDALLDGTDVDGCNEIDSLSTAVRFAADGKTVIIA